MTTVRTSTSHPIHIDWLKGFELGRVGLTFAPGKHSSSVYQPGVLWRRDLAKDLDDLVALGATDLVCLLTDADLSKLKIERLFDEAAARGLRIHHLPLVDQAVPSDRAALFDLLEVLQTRLAEGASVVIHCEGGRGRTGVVAGCLLVSLGASASDALRTLREARGENCPENRRQRAFIERLAVKARPWAGLTPTEPITLGPLTLFLLGGADCRVPAITSLADAVAAGTARVGETDGYQHVTLDNFADVPVLCLAGDVVKGGMQDRVLRHDLLIAPRQTGLVVDVFCVEQGRWAGRAGEPSQWFGSQLHMAPALLRRRLIVGTEQTEVWREVHDTQERLGRSRGRAMRDERSTSSLGLSLELPELQREVLRLLEPLRPTFERGDVRGHLAHIDGVGWHLEWFATRALFRANHDRLLRALVAEALATPVRCETRPGLAEATRWLASASLLETTERASGGVARRKHRTRAGTAMSVLCWPDSEVLHGMAVSC